MSRSGVVLVGGGKLAGLLYAWFGKVVNLIGYIDDVHAPAYVELTYGLPLLGRSSRLSELDRESHAAVVAITDPGARRKYRLLIQEAGLELQILIADTALVSPYARTGQGCVIRPQAIVSPQSVLNENCLVGDQAYIGHDVLVGKDMTLAPGVKINGSAVIGEACMVGTGAVILPGVVIGDGAVVGAAACVHRDVAAGTTVIGVPARPRRPAT